MTGLIGVYGASGFGREILPLVRAGHRDERVVFIDDGITENKVNGVDVLNWNAFLAERAEKKSVSLAIADSGVRKLLAERCRQSGILPAEVRARDVQIYDDVEIGTGAILCAHVTLTSNIRIGTGFHANIYSYVAHDCVIGDFVTFAPRVSCNGNVHIEDHVYIGTGAIIRQGTLDKPLVIGCGAMIGMGAIVTKDVPPGAVMVGNPARALIKD